MSSERVIYFLHSESGLGSPARTSEELLTPQTPPHALGRTASSTGVSVETISPPLCTSPPAKEHQPTNDSIARFKT